MWSSKYHVCVLKPNNISLRRYQHLKLWNCTKTTLVRTHLKNTYKTLYSWSVITPMIFCLQQSVYFYRYYFRWQWSFVPETYHIAKLKLNTPLWIRCIGFTIVAQVLFPSVQARVFLVHHKDLHPRKTNPNCQKDILWMWMISWCRDL